jgi:hypothetical protein
MRFPGRKRNFLQWPPLRLWASPTSYTRGIRVVGRCRVVWVCQCFGGPCCFHHQTGSTDLWNAGKFVSVYTALQPGRQPIFMLTAARTSNPINEPRFIPRIKRFPSATRVCSVYLFWFTTTVGLPLLVYNNGRSTSSGLQQREIRFATFCCK